MVYIVEYALKVNSVKYVVYFSPKKDTILLTRKPVGSAGPLNLWIYEQSVTSYLKDVILGSRPSVNRKLLAHILTNVSTPHPPPHTQTSELEDYNKLSLRLNLKM